MSLVILSSEKHHFSKEQRFELFKIMRDAYSHSETEIWGGSYLRMSQDEYENLIDEGKIMGAILDGKIVGSVYSRNINSNTSTFGLLAVHGDFGNRGIGNSLVEAVEKRAVNEGSKFMDIEILRPRDFVIPIKDRLRHWYEGINYVFTHSQNFQDRRPDRAKELKVPSVFDCYRKELER
jgi:ribosomal protein S18 acetylase RimI-like enzyme